METLKAQRGKGNEQEYGVRTTKRKRETPGIAQEGKGAKTQSGTGLHKRALDCLRSLRRWSSKWR